MSVKASIKDLVSMDMPCQYRRKPSRDITCPNHIPTISECITRRSHNSPFHGMVYAEEATIGTRRFPAGLRQDPPETVPHVLANERKAGNCQRHPFDPLLKRLGTGEHMEVGMKG